MARALLGFGVVPSIAFMALPCHPWLRPGRLLHRQLRHATFSQLPKPIQHYRRLRSWLPPHCQNPVPNILETHALVLFLLVADNVAPLLRPGQIETARDANTIKACRCARSIQEGRSSKGPTHMPQSPPGALPGQQRCISILPQTRRQRSTSHAIGSFQNDFWTLPNSSLARCQMLGSCLGGWSIWPAGPTSKPTTYLR